MDGEAGLKKVGTRPFGGLVPGKAGDRERAPIADREVTQSFSKSYARRCRAMLLAAYPRISGSAKLVANLDRQQKLVLRIEYRLVLQQRAKILGSGN